MTLAGSRSYFVAGSILAAASVAFVGAAGGQEDQTRKKVAVLQTGPQRGHYLTWRGKPILPVGDSLTQGWQWTGANFDSRAYLDALSSRGINTTMIWTYMGVTGEGLKKDKRVGYDAPELWPWAGSPDDKSFDVTRLNREYFDALKEFVTYAEKKGLLVLLTVHDGGAKWSFDSGHPFNADYGNGPLSDARQYTELAEYGKEMPEKYNPLWSRQQKNQYFQERFCDKLISELQGYSNVMYEMFNEGRKPYNPTQRKRHEEHFMAFFKARCDNLVFTNADHIDAGYDPHKQRHADVVTWHGDWGNRFADFQGGFNQAPAMPYFQSEPVPGWDGTNLTVDEIRAGMWQVVLAGAGWVAQNDASFGWDRRTAIAARSKARDRLYDYIGHCAGFFNSGKVDLPAMKPMGKLASTGICLASPGNSYVTYAPDGGDFTLDLTATKEAQAHWYNPRTGKASPGEEIAGGKTVTFTAPDRKDWVLCVFSREAAPAEDEDTPNQ